MISAPPAPSSPHSSLDQMRLMLRRPVQALRRKKGLVEAKDARLKATRQDKDLAR